MGPLRGMTQSPRTAPRNPQAPHRRVRQIAAMAAVCAAQPSVALAEVCDKLRPGWDGAQVTALGEALHLASSLPAVILILSTAIVVKARSQWGGLAVVCGWSFLTYFFALGTGATRIMARAEGCAGSPTLFIAAVAAICVAIILYTAPTRGRSET